MLVENGTETTLCALSVMDKSPFNGPKRAPGTTSFTGIGNDRETGVPEITSVWILVVPCEPDAFDVQSLCTAVIVIVPVRIPAVT